MIDVPDSRRRFEMSLDGVRIHIEYEDESVLRKAIKGLVQYEYLVYLFNYGSYLPWADGIRERVKEHIVNKFSNLKSEFMLVSLYRL